MVTITVLPHHEICPNEATVELNTGENLLEGLHEHDNALLLMKISPFTFPNTHSTMPKKGIIDKMFTNHEQLT